MNDTTSSQHPARAAYRRPVAEWYDLQTERGFAASVVYDNDGIEMPSVEDYEQI